MAEFKNMVVYLLIAGLFVFAMLNFAFEFAVENQTNVSLAQDQSYNATQERIRANLTRALDTANAQKEAFEKDEGIIGFGSILLQSVVGAWKVLITIPVALWNITFGLVFDKIFSGADSSSFAIVFGVLSAAFIISILLLVWRLIKIGE